MVGAIGWLAIAFFTSACAASRLLTALGFGADSNYLVEHLRCYGCPRFPFQTTRLLGLAGIADLLEHTGEHLHADFNRVAVERRFGGRPIVGDRQKGWDGFELSQIVDRAPCPA